MAGPFNWPTSSVPVVLLKASEEFASVLSRKATPVLGLPVLPHTCIRPWLFTVKVPLPAAVKPTSPNPAGNTRRKVPPASTCTAAVPEGWYTCPDSSSKPAGCTFRVWLCSVVE